MKILTVRVDVSKMTDKELTDLEMEISAQIMDNPKTGKVTMTDDHEDDDSMN